MSPEVDVTTIHHRALGPLIRVRIAGGTGFDLTAQEAGIFARGLKALRDGRSAEGVISMIPIAGDHAVTVTAGTDGAMVEAGGGPVALPWPAVERLSAALIQAAG